MKAAVDALARRPGRQRLGGRRATSSITRDVNLGIAVALDWGLIVPVIKDADEKNLLGLSRGVADLARRARSKQLKPDEVSGGTFTITNPGVFGALFGMPIINQPQVAILGVGNVEKRPVVVDDAIAIRPMAYLSLGYDHRIIDGAVADEFMSHMKQTLENWDPRRPEHDRTSGTEIRWPPIGIVRVGSGIVRCARGSPARPDPMPTRSRCSALVDDRRAGSRRRHAVAARASARAHLGVRGDGGRSHILASPRRWRRAASRCSRPDAAATSRITVPARSSAIRSST